MPDPRHIIDTGPIVALLNRRDLHHAWAKATLGALSAPPVTCEAVLTEVCWHLRESPEAVTRVLEMAPRGELRPENGVRPLFVELRGLRLDV